jgi:hypothetical protein
MAIQKNDIKTIAITIVAFVAFGIFSTYVSDDSLIKTIAAWVLTAAFIITILTITSLGNPIRNLFNKFK